jgi:hypothetical protein
MPPASRPVRVFRGCGKVVGYIDEGGASRPPSSSAIDEGGALRPPSSSPTARDHPPRQNPT